MQDAPPFRDHLSALLPEDLPHRAAVIEKTTRHLEAIVEINRQFNLTRIIDPRDAAIKHVLDSVVPWNLFAESKHVLDAGTGAGFPGIPLALCLPGVKFTLSESIGKKARFVEAVVKELGLADVEVVNARAEEWLKIHRPDMLTARAVAPIERFADLFASAIRRGARALLYKGPDVEAEIASAGPITRRLGLKAKIISKYELPDGAGSRTIVEVSLR